MRRAHPVALLAVLSPFVAEFLLGDQWLASRTPDPSQVGAFAVDLLFYGSAAVLLREVVRRAGGGWPAMLTLSLAFGVVEEGLVTQSLFDPDYAGAHLLAHGLVPGLGIGVPWTVFVLSLHVVWSLGAPIALAEAAFGTDPWLRRRGVLAWGAALLVGAAVTAYVNLTVVGAHDGHPFLAPWPRLLGAAAVAALLVAVARRLVPRRSSWTPRTPAAVGVAVGLAATGAFQLARALPGPWPLGVDGMLLAWALGALAVVRWRPPVGALGSGAVLTYGVVGLRTAAAAGPAALVEQTVLVLAAVVVLGWALRRSARRGGTVAGAPYGVVGRGISRRG